MSFQTDIIQHIKQPMESSVTWCNNHLKLKIKENQRESKSVQWTTTLQKWMLLQRRFSCENMDFSHKCGVRQNLCMNSWWWKCFNKSRFSSVYSRFCAIFKEILKILRLGRMWGGHDLWPPSSNQFIFGSKWMNVPNWKTKIISQGC